MDSVINKLTEIEDAASAIVTHAEEQKAALDQEYEEKKAAFDRELEEKTEKRLQAIRTELEREKQKLLGDQEAGNQGAVELLVREYEENHAQYAREILDRITEV